MCIRDRAAKRQAKAEIFPRAISTTELPSNPSPLTFRNNQIQSYRPLRHTQPWQLKSLSKIRTHAGRPCHTHAHTFNARQRDRKADSPAAHCRMGSEINVVLQQQRMVNCDLSLASHNMCASSLFLWGGRKECLALQTTLKTRPRIARTSV